MVSLVPADAATLRDFDERFRRIAFRIGVAGFCVVVASFLLSAASGTLTSTSGIEATTYAVILALISIASYRDFQTKYVLHGGLLMLFAAYWMFSSVEFQTGQIEANSIVFALFIPAFIAIGLDYRLQFALAPIQGGMIWYGFDHYASTFLSDTLADSQQMALGLTIAGFSATQFALLGLVQLARQTTDKRLADVITEKDRLASTDPLTGLLNRRAFLDTIRTVSRADGALTILFIDLNNFKPLNDQYGHAAGDAVLKTIAGRLAEAHNVHFAARPGGDEFAACINPSLSADEVDAAITRLYSDLIQNVSWDDELIHVGLSLGYAHMPQGKHCLSACLSEADAAMRRAKSLGGGFARFSADIDGETIETEHLQASFPKALSSGLIRPALQPIADARTLSIVGHELLSRWEDPDQQRQPGPDEFIPIAEKLGLLNDLLWMTLDEVLTHSPEAARALAINVSPGQLQKPEFVDTLMRVIASHDVKPEAITLEITEQVALRNVEANIAVLEHARRAGMSIALDDFGTGYSSLSMLDRLPLDKLKLDQSLLRANDIEPSENAILKGAIRLARELGLTCCVEGVSSAEIATQVMRLGANEVQGFWIGKPKLVVPKSGYARKAS